MASTSSSSFTLPCTSISSSSSYYQHFDTTASLKERVSLEKAISRLNQVSKPHLEETHAIFSSEYPVPELLLRPEEGRLLSDYIEGPLESDNPIFSLLNEKLNELIHIDHLQPSLSKVKSVYAHYIENVCSAEGKQRWKLLKGNVWLSADIQGKPVCFEISRKLGRKLASLNRYNKTVKNNREGAGAVIQHGKVFFKRAIRNPLNPCMAYATHEFARILFDNDTPPGLLIQLDNIVVKERKSSPIKIRRVSHILQASKEVQGYSLQKILLRARKNRSYRDFIETISEGSFTKGFILDLLCLPRDARSDNFQISDKLYADEKRGVRSIDYDDCFVKPIENGIVEFRSTRFLLGPLMSKSIDAGYKRHIASLNVENFLIDWIASIDEYNTKNSEFQARHLSTSVDAGQVFTPLTLSSDTLVYIYETLITLQTVFCRDDNQCSHWDLLEYFQPVSCKIYQALVAKYPDDPLSAEEHLFVYPRRLVDLKFRLKGFLDDIKEDSYSPPKSTQELPFGSLISWMKRIFPKITPEKQEEILEKISVRFPYTTELELANLKISDRALVRLPSLFRHLKELTILSGETITQIGLRALINDFPDLILTIDKSLSLPETEVIKLCCFAKNHRRNLNYIIQDRPYTISSSHPASSGSDLKFHTAARHGHFEAIPLFLSLGEDSCGLDEKGYGTLHHAIYPKLCFEFVSGLLNALSPQEVKSILALPNSDGNTVLHMSVWHRDPRLVKLLIDAGAEINVVNRFGYTPLHYAAQFHLKESAMMLLKAGARVDMQANDFETPLSLALEDGRDDVIRLLMDPSLVDADEDTIEEAFREGGTLRSLMTIERNSHISFKVKKYAEAAALLNHAFSFPMSESRQFHYLPVLKFHLEKIHHFAQVETPNPVFASNEELLQHLRKKHRNQPHPDIAKRLEMMAFECLDSGDDERAYEHIQSAVSVSLKLYGVAPHPDMARLLTLAGSLSRDRGNARQAIAILEGSLMMHLLIDEGLPTGQLVTTLFHLGQAYKDSGDNINAIKFYHLALFLFDEFIGPLDLGILEILASCGMELAGAWVACGDIQKGITCSLDALGKFRQMYGEEPDISYAFTLSNLALFYLKTEEYRSAADYYTLSIDMLKRLYPDGLNDSIGKDILYLGNSFLFLGEYHSALTCYQEALEIFIKTLGEDSVYALEAKKYIEGIKYN